MTSTARGGAPGLRILELAPELVLSGAAATLIVLEVWVFEPGPFPVARTVAGVLAAGSLLAIRRRPFAAFLVNGVAVYALIGFGQPSDFYQWTNLVALFAVAAKSDWPRATSALVMGWVGVVAYFLRMPEEGGPALTAAVLAIWTAAWFAGRAQLMRSRQLEAAWERDLTRAELAAQQARAELEDRRSAIARDLHDTIGHAVNVMVIQAGAGRGIEDADPRTREVFDTIAATGRAALADLDRMLAVLHGEADLSPLPGLDDLADLVEGLRGDRLEVTLEVRGPRERVPASLGVTAYRIVQEALTNVIKHADAGRVEVVVTIGPDLTIRVSDDGRGGEAEPGRGLGGIAARAEIHRGSMRAGPRTEGGFEVECRLPLDTP